MENGFSRKEFSLTVKFKAFDPGKYFQPKFYLQIISGDAQREKEREKGLTRKHREREIASPESWDRRTTGEIVNPRSSNPRTTNPWTANPQPTNGEPTNPRSDREPTNRESHRADRTGESHRYRSRSCDFDFLLSPFDLWFFCCCCGGVGGGVLVVFLLCGGGFCVGGGGK